MSYQEIACLVLKTSDLTYGWFNKCVWYIKHYKFIIYMDKYKFKSVIR